MDYSLCVVAGSQEQEIMVNIWDISGRKEDSPLASVFYQGLVCMYSFWVSDEMNISILGKS